MNPITRRSNAVQCNARAFSAHLGAALWLQEVSRIRLRDGDLQDVPLLELAVLSLIVAHELLIPAGKKKKKNENKMRR